MIKSLAAIALGMMAEPEFTVRCPPDERQKFERWHNSRYKVLLQLNAKGMYTLYSAQTRWEGWLAKSLE